MSNCLVEFSMSPLDKGPSLSHYVARSLDIVDRSGLPYELHSMGTILEGEFAECLRVIEQCFERMRIDCDRITCSIKVDYRRDARDRLRGKVAAVEARLGRKLPGG